MKKIKYGKKFQVMLKKVLQTYLHIHSQIPKHIMKTSQTSLEIFH